MALAGKADKKNYRVYVLLGDGENQEGQVWEAAMASAHHHAENLVAIIDRNHVQMCGTTDDILDPGDIASKYSAFGWNTIVIDGHDMAAVIAALDRRFENGKPTAIVAETVKGKGVSYMEGRFEWHGAAPDKEHYELAMQELRGHLR